MKKYLGIILVIIISFLNMSITYSFPAPGLEGADYSNGNPSIDKGTDIVKGEINYDGAAYLKNIEVDKTFEYFTINIAIIIFLVLVYIMLYISGFFNGQTPEKWLDMNIFIRIIIFIFCLLVPFMLFYAMNSIIRIEPYSLCLILYGFIKTLVSKKYSHWFTFGIISIFALIIWQNYLSAYIGNLI